jgi:integrase
MRLTVKNVETIRPGANRREIPDGHMPGLYLILQPSGARSWAVRYRFQGATRKHTLGSFPAINLKAARAVAGKALRTVAEGRDPSREKILARAAKADSVGRIVEEFLERHVRRSNRASTARETERLFRQDVLPCWRSRMVHDITRRDVLALLDRIVDGGAPIVANRVLAAIRKFFNWCVARDIIAVSPCAGVKPPTLERARDRMLSDAELKLVWQAAGELGFPFGPLVRLLILTGQRRDEVAGMKWDEVDFERRLWVLPRERTKAARPHEVPLSNAALDVLNVPHHAGSPFVFTTNGASAVSGYSKAKRRLDALLPPDMPSWRLHDLRRTFASGAARLGVNLPVIEKILNHVSGSFAGVVGVYQLHDFAAEKRAVLEAWGSFVTALVDRKPGSKVLRLRGKRS